MKIEMWGTEPVAQGSKTGFVRGGRAVLVDANATKLKPWREALASEAVTAMQGRPAVDGPCVMWISFYFTRPKAHYDSKGEVKLSAPDFKHSKPDLDKLIRAVGDALTGSVVRDDSRFVRVSAVKRYGDVPGVVIYVTEV